MERRGLKRLERLRSQGIQEIDDLRQAGKEVNKPAEMVIRAHHLPIYSELEKGKFHPYFYEYSPISPGQQAAGEVRAFRIDRMVSQYRVNSGNVTKKDVSALAYYIDVIGSTYIDSLRAERRLRKVYQKFKNLKEKDTIDIVVKKKDDICNTCIFGNHCTTADKKNFDSYTKVPLRSDRQLFETFIREAKSIGLKDQLVKFQAKTDYSDRENTYVTCLRTNAGVVRAVLRESEALEPLRTRD